MKSKIEIISQLITLYYGLYQSSVNVTPTFSLADFLSCFEVGVCEVSCLLPESTNQIGAGTAIDHFSLEVEIKSDLSQSILMSLASFIYQVSHSFFLLFLSLFPSFHLFHTLSLSLSLSLFLPVSPLLPLTLSLSLFLPQIPLLRCNCTGLNQILINCPVSCYSLTVSYYYYYYNINVLVLLLF